MSNANAQFQRYRLLGKNVGPRSVAGPIGSFLSRGWVIPALLYFTAVLIRIPALTQELPPYVFCDEAIWLTSVEGLLGADLPLVSEFRSGGLNIYPVFFVAEFLGFLSGSQISSTELLLLGRVLLTVLVGSGAVVFIYLTTRILFRSNAISLIAGAAFLISPFVYSVSRYWYPDHYMMVMSAGVLYFAVRATLESPRFSIWGFAGLFLGLAISVKYTGVMLVIPLLVAAFASVRGIENSSTSPTTIRNMVPYWFWSISTAAITTTLINASAFFQQEKFRADFQFNIENYGRDGFNTSGVIFYLLLLFVLSMSVPGVVAYILGYRFLYKRSKTLLVLLGLFPIFLAIYLGSAQLVVNRNMSIAIPFVLPVFALGWVSLTALAPGWRRVTGWMLAAVILAAPFLQLAASVTKDLRTDSRILAAEWLLNGLPQGAVVGTNEACSGPSPAQSAGFMTQNDPEMSEMLQYYVMNSYWGGTLLPAYRSTGILQQLDQKYLHYYNGFSDPAPFRFSTDPPSVEDLADARGYRILKTFSSNGPEIVVLERR